ncbi:MAG: glucosamine-6-phosphate deaminase [Pirellulaceae bacterium]|nr:glucosamine-6-phosphate deaminase [Pirellulaceae bacterium]
MPNDLKYRVLVSIFNLKSPFVITNNSQVSVKQASHVKLPCYVFDRAPDLAAHVATIIETVIQERNALGQNAVLGLPTGSTPVNVYRELVRKHKQEGLDLSRVITFNLDEYYGVAPEKLQSYHRWMHEQFFNHVNIPQENIYIPDGLIPLDRVGNYCREFEARITEAGGIDVVLLGIGSNGHIGFNEPFSVRQSRTRLCTLDPMTRKSASSDFFGEQNVPTQAITMGLGTILEARKILLLAQGEHKASIIKELCEGIVSPRVPASHLQDHADATVLVDEAAGSKLTSSETPWLVSDVQWNDELIKKAVIWLCETTGNTLLKLSDDDFRNHNLHHLLRAHGPGSKIAHRVFKGLMGTIEYHPAGKESKRVICFSPHPDDDVISMGGTLIRLNEDRHEVHIAYMTSGNIAVFDHDAMRVANLVTEFNRRFGIDQERSLAVEAEVTQAFDGKHPGERDVDAVRQIKSLIRWSEAKAGALVAGCLEENCHFLDLPFYRTGTVDKKPWGNDDVKIIRDLIHKINPDQIYVAGDLSDPHGTHRLCAEAIFEAVRQIDEECGGRPEVLLYRGAWQEYDLHEIQIAVPLSPTDMEIKKKAIFKHESQKDEALFPGSDPREFWQRAEDRNTGTADKYNAIGLPEYFALEAFVRWDGIPI